MINSNKQTEASHKKKTVVNWVPSRTLFAYPEFMCCGDWWSLGWMKAKSFTKDLENMQ